MTVIWFHVNVRCATGHAGVWEEDPWTSLNNKPGAEMQTHTFFAPPAGDPRWKTFGEVLVGSVWWVAEAPEGRQGEAEVMGSASVRTCGGK